MSNLNIRNIDEELVAKLKSIAAIERKHLRDVVIEVLEKHVVEKQEEMRDVLR